MTDVTLYHWEPNANSGKPMLALMEKGVAFDSHYLDLLSFDQHKPDYLAVNPQGTIPAMKHGDLVLTESTAIMEYVDEVFPGHCKLDPPVLPAPHDDPLIPAVDPVDPQRIAATRSGATRARSDRQQPVRPRQPRRRMQHRASADPMTS